MSIVDVDYGEIETRAFAFVEMTPMALRSFGWRPVSKKRARTLRRRGEFVCWLQAFDNYAWLPKRMPL